MVTPVGWIVTGTVEVTSAVVIGVQYANQAPSKKGYTKYYIKRGNVNVSYMDIR